MVKASAAAALPDLMTTAEAARYFKVTQAAIWQRIQRRSMPYTKIGGRVYILRNELAAELERNRREIRK